MAKTFSAEAKPLKDILFHEDARLEVPSYQREFSWEKEQLEPFWENLIAPGVSEGGFCGSLLLVEEDANSRGTSEIVDGQQRSTVSTIVICVLRDIASTLGVPKTVNKMQEGDIENVDGDDLPDEPASDSTREFKLIASPTCKEFFKARFQCFPKKTEPVPVTNEEKRLVRAYDYFYHCVKEKLDETERREEKISIINAVRRNVRNLLVVLILVHDESIKFEIFESVNARGMSLSPSDLIKNYLMSVNQDRQAAIALEWQGCGTTAEEIGTKLTDVIRYYWNGKIKFTPTKKLFESIKFELNKIDGGAANFLVNITDTVEVFKILLTGADPVLKDGFQGNKKYARDFCQCVQLLRQLKTKQHLVLFLTLYRHRETLPGAWVSKIAIQTARFSIAHFGLCQKPGNQVERLFARNARGLEEAINDGSNKKIVRACNNIVKELADRWPAKVEIVEQLEAVRYEPAMKAKSVIRTLFACMEFASNSDREITMNWDDLTIEHLQPQNPSDSTDSEFGESIHELGNLVLLHGRSNKIASNKSATEKLEILEKCNLNTTNEAGRFITKKGEWNVELLNERTDLIIRECMELFGSAPHR